jgi:predicted  nucleic acid-binding Zn-ribbon protein
MESGLELLVKLQQLDAEIESVRDELERIPQELRIADEELAQARTDLDSFEEELAGIVAGQKDCERKKVESKALLTDYRNKLLSIRTNDEYRAMLGQIGFVEKQIDDLDSRTIELMYAEDEARGRLDGARTKFERSSQRTDRKKQLLTEKSAGLQASLDDLHARRAEIAPTVNIRLSRKYEQLRTAGKRVAVVQLQKGACGGCMTNVPPQNAVEIEQGATYSCPICGRFVVCSFQTSEKGIEN